MQNCKSVISRGPQKGNQCSLRPHAGQEYCFKHRATATKKTDKSKARQEAFEADEIFAKKDEPLPKTSRNSTWNLTINSNTSYERMSAEERKAFKEYIEGLLISHKITQYISDRTSPEDSAKNIVKIDTDVYFEVGPRNGFLHCHGYLRIEHTGFLSMRLNDLRADMKKQFGKALHVDAPVTSNSDAVWGAYIAKNSAADKV